MCSGRSMNYAALLGTGRSLLSLHPNTPARHWPLLWRASSHWKNTEIYFGILVNEVFDLFSVFIKAKLTVGWIFTGKLCLCSALRMKRKNNKIVLRQILPQIPTELHLCYLFLFSQSIPKYSSFYLSRLFFQASLDKPPINSCSVFSKICKHRAGTNSEKL